MSLNKTLDRLFDEIRREAKRNPDFANRLDAVLRLHDSKRDVPDEVIEEVATDVSSPARGGSGARAARDEGGKRLAGKMPAVPSEPSINPVGLYRREGEDALTDALIALDDAALQALIAEHNLDPAGETAEMEPGELILHVIAQAKRRAERDEKLFDY